MSLDAGEAALPRDEAERRALARVHLLRQVSGWGAVVWFPLVLVLVSLGHGSAAFGVTLAGAVFSGLLRLAVALATCPRCGGRYVENSQGFQEIWQRDRCVRCGLRRYAH
ncbi:MAG: hypothetical protein QF570_22410 [Myxococcota bacterium]|jgi:hypothetical protein|nr:hypothetical protein [Myxococcota bacterium]